MNKMAIEQRLIDANNLSVMIEETAQGLADCDQQNAAWALRKYAIRDITEAPTVDAVEVVRCKDCEKWKCHGMPFDITKGTCYNPRFHFHHGHVLDECFMPVTNETDFCSYGERRTGNG